MLRVGLTGGLGSGKTTVAAMLRAHGAYVLQADEIGRLMMQPGQAVYQAIVARFGPSVVQRDETLDRAELARLAFAGGRLDELNAIVHPAVIEEQDRLTREIAARDREAVVVLESALIFETRFGSPNGGPGGWHSRFDRLVLVVASEETKIRRYVERSCGGSQDLDPATRGDLETEARRRLAQQIPDDEKRRECNDVITNDGSFEALRHEVDELWTRLQKAAASMPRQG